MKQLSTTHVERGTRLVRMDLLEGGVWRVWSAMDATGKLGTYFLLHPDGTITRVTERIDRGPEELRIVD